MNLKKKKKTKDGRFWFRCDQKQIDFFKDIDVDMAGLLRNYLNSIYVVNYDRKEKNKVRKKSAVAGLSKRPSAVVSKKKAAPKKRTPHSLDNGQRLSKDC